MKDRDLHRLLKTLGDSGLSPGEALEMLNSHMTHHLGFAVVDGGRGSRSVLPEVVMAGGKTPGELAEVTRSLLENTGLAIVSRLETDAGDGLGKLIPEGRYYRRCGLFVAGEYSGDRNQDEGHVAIVSAGTSDLHASEEAAVVLETMKADVQRFYDVGVAGLHRIAGAMPSIRKAAVCIVFAGMDAALPTVLGGLFRGPVVAVPTSTGYGTAFGGVTALLSMLNSCSPGICVMNIDNGLGAAAAALRMIRGGK